MTNHALPDLEVFEENGNLFCNVKVEPSMIESLENDWGKIKEFKITTHEDTHCFMFLPASPNNWMAMRFENYPKYKINDKVYRGDEWGEDLEGVFLLSDVPKHLLENINGRTPETMPISLADKVYTVVGMGDEDNVWNFKPELELDE